MRGADVHNPLSGSPIIGAASLGTPGAKGFAGLSLTVGWAGADSSRRDSGSAASTIRAELLRVTEDKFELIRH